MPNSAEARPATFAWAPLQALILFGLLVFTLIVRARTFDNPVLGFDEQFYLLVGDRMRQGTVPYVDIFDHKPIGLFLIYAAIRTLGGDGFLQYKLVASGFVAVTAFLIYRAALPISDRIAAGIAACLYVLWLNLAGGEGGQAQVFYNLPVLMAAMLTWRAGRMKEPIVALGAGAMLLVGIALQIKYTAIFEGLFFGGALLWAHHRVHRRRSALIAPALCWIGCALLPTAAAAFAYWRIGALGPFIFANFFSIFARVPDPALAQLMGLAAIGAILVPILLFAVLSLRGGASACAAEGAFPFLWLAAAILGVLLFGSFLSPQYGLPVLAPGCIAAAPFFAGRRPRRWLAVGTLAVALVVGQIAMARSEFRKGGLTQALMVARAAQPRHGCIYVYDGYPALYMLTHSCLPTRWVFPGHLNTSDEASAKALGVDPVVEVRRILETRPEVIVDDAPAFALGNAATRALVESALARDYALAAKVETGHGRFRLVYRLKEAAPPQ